jgi:RNA polymerase sigma-70 factor (ECF subfamily)
MLYAQCCDAELALDALHEAILRLCQEGGEVRDPPAWILRVGRNWLRDAWRRNRHASPAGDGLEHVIGPAPEPHVVVAAKEVRNVLRQVFANLATTDREVLALRYALGWDSKRIATTLGSTVSAIDMRISRARRRYADALQAAGVTRETV